MCVLYLNKKISGTLKINWDFWGVKSVVKTDFHMIHIDSLHNSFAEGSDAGAALEGLPTGRIYFMTNDFPQLKLLFQTAINKT